MQIQVIFWQKENQSHCLGCVQLYSNRPGLESTEWSVFLLRENLYQTKLQFSPISTFLMCLKLYLLDCYRNLKKVLKIERIMSRTLDLIFFSLCLFTSQNQLLVALVSNFITFTVIFQIKLDFLKLQNSFFF